MKPKRICISPATLDDGGVGRYAINLAQGLLAEGAEVDLFLNSDQGGLFPQRPKEARVFYGKGQTKNSLGAFYSYLRQEQPDLLITAHSFVNLSSLVLRFIAGTRTKVAITIHTASSRDDEDGQSQLKRLYTRACRFIYPFADTVVAVSKAVANDSATHFKLRKPVKVIYNPVVNDDLYQKSTAPLSHPFFSSKTAPVFLSIGRLTEQKDFPTLLKAFAGVRKTCAAKLIILGEGEDRAKLEALIQELALQDDVSLPGFVSNPYPFLKAADVFVSSSAWEGLPTVIIEALALGTPVVATDCPGGTKEILQDTYGDVVAMANPQALAEAMLKRLTKPTDKNLLAQRAKDFSVAAAAKTYLQLLETSQPLETIL